MSGVEGQGEDAMGGVCVCGWGLGEGGGGCADSLLDGQGGGQSNLSLLRYCRCRVHAVWN